MPDASDNDPALLGCWRVVSVDMIEGCTVSLIGGLPGEFAEFTTEGLYRVDLRERRPCESRYRVAAGPRFAELDVWTEGMETRPARCLYEVTADALTICIAGNSRPRPDELCRDDKLLWCVQRFERAQPPRRSTRRASAGVAKPGSLIPQAFLKRPSG